APGFAMRAELAAATDTSDRATRHSASFFAREVQGLTKRGSVTSFLEKGETASDARVVGEPVEKAVSARTPMIIRRPMGASPATVGAGATVGAIHPPDKKPEAIR